MSCFLETHSERETWKPQKQNYVVIVFNTMVILPLANTGGGFDANPWALYTVLDTQN